MNELLNEILECIEFVSNSVNVSFPNITEKWKKCSQIYDGIAEKIDVTWRIPLDSNFLEEFPDIRTKMAKKLEWFASDQISVLLTLIKKTHNITQCLKTKIDIINKRLEHISFEEHSELRNSIREIVMWLDDCFTCFHCLYMQLDFSMISLHMSGDKSVSNLSDAIIQDEKDKLVVEKSQTYKQNCMSLLKYLDNRNKIKITL